jgi:hypothetical protein
MKSKCTASAKPVPRMSPKMMGPKMTVRRRMLMPHIVDASAQRRKARLRNWDSSAPRLSGWSQFTTTNLVLRPDGNRTGADPASDAVKSTPQWRSMPRVPCVLPVFLPPSFEVVADVSVNTFKYRVRRAIVEIPKTGTVTLI